MSITIKIDSPRTVTTNKHVSLFPDPSVAVYVTLVFPIEKMLLGECEVVRPTLLLLSAAVGSVQETLEVDSVALTETVMSLGQPEITGVSTSVIKTKHRSIDAQFNQ